MKRWFGRLLCWLNFHDDHKHQHKTNWWRKTCRRCGRKVYGQQGR